jgi:hypothetical protein
MDVLGEASGVLEDRFARNRGDGLPADATSPTVDLPAFRPTNGQTPASADDAQGGSLPEWLPLALGVLLAVVAAQALGVIDLS